MWGLTWKFYVEGTCLLGVPGGKRLVQVFENIQLVVRQQNERSLLNDSIAYYLDLALRNLHQTVCYDFRLFPLAPVSKLVMSAVQKTAVPLVVGLVAGGWLLGGSVGGGGSRVL